MSAAEMDARTSELEIKLVVLSEPFHRTLEPLIKLLPSTVSVKEGPPAVAHEGLKLVTIGPGSRISYPTELESLPSGLDTVIGMIPGVAMSTDVMDAFSWVVDTNVVARSEPPQETFEPLMK
jgi:hypothetical protein